MSARVVAALAVVAALLAADAPARAGCRETTDATSVGADGCPDQGKPLYWKKACVDYSLSEDASVQIDFAPASDVVAQAFATWSTASCGGAPPGIQFIDQGATALTTVEYQEGGSNTNLVVFRDSDWPHDEGAHAVALTTVTFDVPTGEILDADMELNSADFELTTTPTTTATDLPSILAHEVGHLLGFAHSDDPEATMGAIYEPGTITIRDLAADDVELLCQTYRPDGTRPTGDGVVVADPCHPDGDEASCPSSTVAGCSAAPASGGASSMAAALLAVALVVVRRRRR
jgi:MYXO-CTERM domain-containing protein